MENRQEENLFSYINAVWRRAQTLHVTAGMLALCRWIVPLFLAVMAIDWLMDLPAALRVAGLAGLLSVSVYKAWRCGWLNVRTFNPTHTALRIEEHVGGFESLLVSAVQLRSSELSPGTSESLRDMACRSAEKAVVPLRPADAIDYQALRRPAAAAIILALIIGGFAFIDGPILAAGVTRIFAPWMSVRYPTRTQVDRTSGHMIAREGGSVRIHASVSGVIPSHAKLALRTGTGKSREHQLEIADGGCEYIIESVFRGFEYRIIAGDARSEWYSVQVIASPRIQSAEVSLKFPPYTDRPTKTVEALTLTVPEGTDITWSLTLDRAVSKANYNPAGGQTQVLDLSADGRIVTMRQIAAQSRAYSFSWVEREHGFAFTGPNHHLQVMPDQRPNVELTSPGSNLYATLGRKCDLAFRGRDDHGIGESVVAYRVNKTAEVKVRFSAADPSGGSEQAIDWDYRTVLPDLAVGDTVSFVVELTDRYPGAEGPHRVRSAARRVTFLSREDYLKHIARRKRRLLSRLRAIYREERGVHDVVRKLDPSSDVFVQTCQLEAVRQDLMRERLAVLTARMHDLMEELAANNIKDESETATLTRLHSDMQTIAEEHVGRAASALRDLTRSSNNAAPSDRPDPAAAVHMVDSAARELGCLVLQIGFREATEVMARELHATAQTQAALRLRTIMHGRSDVDSRAGSEELAKAQTRLTAWCTRLLSAIPRNKESTSKDALVAFNLARLTKKLLGEGTIDGMRQAAALIPQAESEKAVHLQSEAIAALLDAEFRLRSGAEYEALFKANKLFTAQVAGQQKLRQETAGLTQQEFARKRTEIAKSQYALQQQLQLLLMPAVPAPRSRLFDAALPSRPPVADLLAHAENEMDAALSLIRAGQRDSVMKHQRQAEADFAKLGGIVRQRMTAMMQKMQMTALIDTSTKQASQIVILEERLVALLEKTEDAADDGVKTARLARLNEALADDVDRLRRNIVHWNETQVTPNEDDLPLVASLGRVVRLLTAAAPLLKANQPDKAINLQDDALGALEEAGLLIAELTATRLDFAVVLETTINALVPSPKLAEIEAEQIDMAALTKKAKPKDRPSLVIPQKNLIHAVQVVVNSLDIVAYKIESGTVLLFAKEDMDAAAIGIETDDIEDALDAQSFVAESLQKLRAKIDKITPQYRYALEVSEFLHELAPQSARIRTGLRQLREQEKGAPDAGALKTKVARFGIELKKLTGQQRFAATSSKLAKVLETWNSDAPSANEPQVKAALGALIADTRELQTLTKNLAYFIAPPIAPEDLPAPSPEIKLLGDVLMLAAHHKDISRRMRTATPEQLADFASQQRKLESKCAAFIPMSKSHPHLVAAHRHLSEAVAKLKASNRAAVISSHHEAGQMLRYFILEYVLKYVMIPPPAPPQDPAPNDEDELEEQAILPLFEPGALTGDKPKGGRQEWQVLGRRDRAALNENFARELPLEYREILKDYYERLAR